MYKPSQGRVARQATFWSLAIIVTLAAWSLHNYFQLRDFGRGAAGGGATAASTTEAPAVGTSATEAPATEKPAAETTAKDGDKPAAAPTGTTITNSDTSGRSEAARAFYLYVVPFALLAGGLWASFRVVQFPPFADFLISVEGEMNKVSWPARGELLRASVVVMFVIFFLAFILFAYDYALVYVMNGIEGFLNWVSSLFAG